MQVKEDNLMTDSVKIPQTARRHFLKGFIGIISGAAILSLGAAAQVFAYFFGSKITKPEKIKFLKTSIERMQAVTSQNELALERVENDYILVSQYNDLSKTSGIYFIDYTMKPALAFLGDNDLPNLLSAKCTHLGCTVGNEVNNGTILCPCHISYFNVQTGVPNAGSPAKLPLPKLNWVIKDKQGKVLTTCNLDGKITGVMDKNLLKDTSVYIVKA